MKLLKELVSLFEEEAFTPRRFALKLQQMLIDADVDNKIKDIELESVANGVEMLVIPDKTRNRRAKFMLVKLHNIPDTTAFNFITFNANTEHAVRTVRYSLWTNRIEMLDDRQFALRLLQQRVKDVLDYMGA